TLTPSTGRLSYGRPPLPPAASWTVCAISTKWLPWETGSPLWVWMVTVCGLNQSAGVNRSVVPPSWHVDVLDAYGVVQRNSGLAPARARRSFGGVAAAVTMTFWVGRWVRTTE